MNIGNFTGNGIITMHYSGLTSEQPEVLWIFPENATAATFTQENRSPKDGYWATGADGSQHAMWSWTGTGFTSGTVQNANTIVYHFIAIDASSDANIEEVVYTGTGDDNLSVTSLGGGFTPSIAFTFGMAANGPPTVKTGSMSAGNAFKVGSATIAETDLIKSFQAAGVNLGTYAAVNVNMYNFNSLVGFSGGTLLPVQLTSFSARKKGTDVALNWESSSEINSDYYEVLHSDDGSNYTSLGKVPAAGNSNHWLNYQFIHEAPGGGVHYYQLVEVDNDGAFEKFKTLAPTMNEQLEIITQMFPNPTRSNVSLYFNSATGGRYDIAVCDVSGKE